MIKTADQLPPRTHNEPPEPVVTVPPSITRAGELIVTANKWMTERKNLTTEEEAGKAQDFVTQLTTAQQTMYKAMRDEKTPHEKIVKEIGAKYSPWDAKVEIAIKAIKALRTVFLKDKQDALDKQKREEEKAAAELARQAKVAEEEAAKALDTPGADAIDAQVRAEQAKAAAEDAAKLAAKPAIARTTGAYSGRQSGLRTTWKARFKPGATPHETNANIIVAMRVMIKNQTVWNAATESAIREASRDASKDGTPPAGMEYYSEQSA